MLDSIPVIVILSTILGFLSGIGVGGGSLLMLWLTVVLNMSHATARGINLLFFIPSALIACCFRWKQGTISLRTVFPAIVSGCLAAALFSWLGNGIQVDILRKCFGFLLLLTGFRELLYKEKKAS